MSFSCELKTDEIFDDLDLSVVLKASVTADSPRNDQTNGKRVQQMTENRNQKSKISILGCFRGQQKTF